MKEKIIRFLRKWIYSPYGTWALAFLSFIESAFFPIPPDFFIIPMVAAKPEIWKRIAWVVSISSILGSFLGYYIGFAFFETFGQFILERYNLVDQMIKIGESFAENSFWSLLLAAFTPLPYKLFTLASGVFKINLVSFTLATIIGRGARYILVPYLAALGGRSVKNNPYLKKMKYGMYALIAIAIILYFVFK